MDFAYDGDGVRVATLTTPYENGSPQTPSLTAYYFGGMYEVTGNDARKYYSFGGQTVAMHDGSGLQYFLSDHLGSIVSVTDASGTLISQQRYLPFGGVREDVGNISQTDYGYTGQRNLDSGIGLMDYKARFYSPYLNRFIQPDMILPDLNNSQYLNRYSYVINQPIVLNDPSGHCPTCLAGLLIGAAIGFTVYALASGDQFNVADAIIATGVGAVGGALIGTGAGLATGSLMIAGISATSASVAAGVASGAGTGLLASQAGYTVAARSNYNRDEMFVAAGTGLVSGVVSGYASAATSAGLITAGAATTARVGMGWIAGASQYSFTELVNGRRPDAGRAIAMGIWGSMLSGIDEIVGPIRVFKYDPSTAIIDDAIIATVRSSTIQYINNQAPNRNTNTGLLSLRME